MKILLLALITFGSFSIMASTTLNCTKKGIFKTFYANVEVNEDISKVSITSASNRALRRGEQSMAPVAYQEFISFEQYTSDNGQVNNILLNFPHLGDGNDESIELDYALMRQSGTELSLKVEGDMLPGFKSIKFKNCK